MEEEKFMNFLKGWFGGKKPPVQASKNELGLQATAAPKSKQQITWKCPKCGELLEKSSILLQRLSENPGVPVAGTLECPKCSGRHKSADIYSGKFDA